MDVKRNNINHKCHMEWFGSCILWVWNFFPHIKGGT